MRVPGRVFTPWKNKPSISPADRKRGQKVTQILNTLPQNSPERALKNALDVKLLHQTILAMLLLCCWTLILVYHYWVSKAMERDVLHMEHCAYRPPGKVMYLEGAFFSF